MTRSCGDKQTGALFLSHLANLLQKIWACHFHHLLNHLVAFLFTKLQVRWRFVQKKGREEVSVENVRCCFPPWCVCRKRNMTFIQISAVVANNKLVRCVFPNQTDRIDRMCVCVCVYSRCDDYKKKIGREHEKTNEVFDRNPNPSFTCFGEYGKREDDRWKDHVDGQAPP